MGSLDFSVGSTLKGTVNWDDKDSSGRVYVYGKMWNPSSSTTCTGNPRISISFDNINWTRIVDLTSLGPGRWDDGDQTFSTGNTSSQTIYISLLTNYDSHMKTGTVGGYVDPTPDYRPWYIRLTPSTQTMGTNIWIEEYGGYGSVNSRTWRAGNDTGSYNTGNWTPSVSQFEPLCPNSSTLGITFYNSSQGGTTSASGTLVVPPEYVPTATHEAVIIDPVNYSLVAGVSKLKIELQPYLLPEGLNSASISDTQLLSVTSSNPAITTSTFTKSGNNYTSGILPTYANNPSYTIRLTFRITDSRRRTADYTTGEYRVTNFVPPYCQITNLHRDTSTTGTLEVKIISSSAAYSAKVKVGSNGTPVDVLNQLVPTQDGYTLTYHMNGLQSGEQYPVTFYFKDTNMNVYGESEYAYSQLLSTMSMPLSLFDNGSRMAASFGEECADNYGEDVVINFAKDAYLRYIDNSSNVVIDKVQNILSSCPFPIGGIYLSTTSTNPSTLWANTSWQQISQGRFLVGVGTGTDGNGDSLTVSGGNEGGEYKHQLTVQEMPSHAHTVWRYTDARYGSDDADHGVANNEYTDTSSSVGGNQSHNNIPPYLGVYMWERIS